jgi:hypothetical protein
VGQTEQTVNKEDRMVIIGETGFVFGCNVSLKKLKASLPTDAKWKLRARSDNFAYITIRLGSSSITTALIETTDRYRFRHLQAANIRNDERTEELLGLIDDE